MGSITGHVCRTCGAHFTVSTGGGFFFDQLHCEQCGKVKDVGHEDMGDIHLGFVKGLGRPYAMARAAFDRHIQQTYPGEPLSKAEYHAAVEATLDPCRCGGRYRYDAPPRCPSCRSTPDQWDEDASVGMTLFD